MSQLIKNNAIVADEWTRVIPPTLGEEVVRKQAGKVVLFKLASQPSPKRKLTPPKSPPQAKSFCLCLCGWQKKIA